MIINGKADISCELSKIESLSSKLARDLFNQVQEDPDNSERRQELEALYWIAESIRDTVIQAEKELYPITPSLKLAA